MARISSVAMLALLLLASPSATQELDEELSPIDAWGGVSSLVETDEDGETRVVGFLLNTEDGESYDIVLDDMGRRLAQEASDRIDVLVEVQGTLSVDGTMVTIHTFAMHFVDPYDQDLADESAEEEASEPEDAGQEP